MFSRLRLARVMLIHSLCDILARTDVTSARYFALQDINKVRLAHFLQKVGVTRFERATSWSQTKRSSQAELHPGKDASYSVGVEAATMKSSDAGESCVE